MSDKLEKLKNLVLSVALNEDIIKFGSKEHLDIIEKLENIDDMAKIKNMEDDSISQIFNIIKNDKKLTKILKDDIGINIKELE